MAGEEKLDPIIGRSKEVRRVYKSYHGVPKIIQFLLVNQVLVKQLLLKD